MEQLKHCCVRTSIKVNEEFENFGSGIIVSDNGEYFVVTSEHCIHGPDGQYKGVSVDDIWVERQSDYSAPFERIAVRNIIEANSADDWAVLSIDQPLQTYPIPSISKLNECLVKEEVGFWGFQVLDKNSHRHFQGKIIASASNQFRINLTGISLQQGAEDGAMVARGLSGSGIFLLNSSKFYLLGIVKNVINENALNNDIDCCPINRLAHLFSEPSCDVTSVNDLKAWEEQVEREQYQIDIENWRSSNDFYFDNLQRKCAILYPSKEKAEEVMRKRLIDYLTEEFKINEIRKVSDLINKYEETSIVFEESVKHDYSRTVSNSNEAKDLLLSLEKEFKEHISNLVGDNSNKRTLELARHKVTWWLLNCSFKFE